MKKINKIIIHGYIVTMDESMEVIEDGAIAISGAEIVDISTTSELLSRYQLENIEIIDAKYNIVMPGLINTHSHSSDVLFRGLFDDLELETWLNKLWNVEKQFINKDSVSISSQLAFAEMIQAGITTSLDMYWYPEIAMQIAKSINFRLMTGPIYFDFSEPDNIPIENRTSLAREFLQEYKNDNLVIPCVLPHSTYTVSPKYIKEAVSLARDYDVLLSTHASETIFENKHIEATYGKRPIELLDSLGFFEGKSVLAHCVHIRDEELKILQKGTVGVSHCPISNLKLGSGIANISKMIEAKINISIGTDGPVSGNDIDLWSSMKIASILQKGINLDPTICTAKNILYMSTLEAAKSLGLSDKIGSLSIGKKADIIIVNKETTHNIPLYDVYSNLVYTVGKGDVISTLINGVVVMENREFKTLEINQIIESVKKISMQISFLSQ